MTQVPQKGLKLRKHFSLLKCIEKDLTPALSKGEGKKWEKLNPPSYDLGKKMIFASQSLPKGGDLEGASYHLHKPSHIIIIQRGNSNSISLT